MVLKNSGYHPGHGLRLFVRHFRDPEAPSTGLTLLIVHGFLDSGETWEMVAEPLARAGHEVLVPDMRGFGESDQVGPGGYYHFADYVADLAMLMDALAPARLGVIGHSMGGTISVLYA